MKKTLSVILSLILISLMCITTFASGSQAIFRISDLTNAESVTLNISNEKTGETFTLNLLQDDNYIAQTSLLPGSYVIKNYEINGTNEYELALTNNTFNIKDSTAVATIDIKASKKSEGVSFFESVFEIIKRNAFELIVLIILLLLYLIVKRIPKKQKNKDLLCASMLEKHEAEQSIFKDDPIDYRTLANNIKTKETKEESVENPKEPDEPE